MRRGSGTRPEANVVCRRPRLLNDKAGTRDSIQAKASDFDKIESAENPQQPYDYTVERHFNPVEDVSVSRFPSKEPDSKKRITSNAVSFLWWISSWLKATTAKSSNSG